MKKRPYQPHEISLIVQHYPDVNTLLALLPGRTRPGIKWQGRHLGLASSTQFWTAKEAGIVAKNYPDLTKIQTLLPHRSKESITRRVRILGLRPSRPAWTAERQELLTKISGKVSDTEAAKMLGGSRRAIENKRSKMGLTQNRPARVRARVPLVQDIRDEARRRCIALSTVTRDLGCQKLRPSLTETDLSIASAAKVVAALGGHLYVEWTD